MTAQTDKQLIVSGGCWIDECNWGRFGPVRLVLLAILHGWTLDGEDEAIFDRLWRERDWPYNASASADDWSALIDQGGMSDEAEEWMNDRLAPEGYRFGWDDGSFYLWPLHTWHADDPGACDCTPEQIALSCWFA